MNPNIDLNKFINNKDLERIQAFLGYQHQFMFMEDEVFSLDQLFQGINSFAIIFLKNPESQVGHWVSIKKTNEKEYEYMDCLANSIPKWLSDLFIRDVSTVTTLTRPIMSKKGIICGKFCIFHALVGNVVLSEWIDMLYANKQYSIEKQVDTIIRMSYDVDLNAVFK